MKLTTAPFKCGEKVKIQSNHLSWIVLIQNEGSSKVDYEVAKYVDDATPTGPTGLSPTVAGLIGGAIGAVVVFIGIFIYKKCSDRKLAEKLKRDSSQQPLV